LGFTIFQQGVFIHAKQLRLVSHQASLPGFLSQKALFYHLLSLNNTVVTKKLLQ
jgi:hypothetical protein